jgi:hypothetical protein
MRRIFLRNARTNPLDTGVGEARRSTSWRRVLSTSAILAVCVPAVIAVGSPTSAGTAYCTDSSRACVISAATSYLNALVSHNSSQVRLAPSAIRTENGYDTGDSGPQIANDLATNAQYLVVHDVRDVRWFVDGDQAIALYLIDAAVPVVGPEFATVHLAERFQVEGGLITQIEAFDCTHPSLTPEPERMTPIVALVNEQCVGE